MECKCFSVIRLKLKSKTELPLRQKDHKIQKIALKLLDFMVFLFITGQFVSSFCLISIHFYMTLKMAVKKTEPTVKISIVQMTILVTLLKVLLDFFSFIEATLT